jgi:hypothetical protein
MKKILPIIIIGLLLVGCATGTTAVEQISSQTDNPGLIALASYADAQDVYIATAQLYLPYQRLLKEVNPDLDAKIIAMLREANRRLDLWGLLGDLPLHDRELFRALIRDITLEIAMLLAKERAQ